MGKATAALVDVFLLLVAFLLIEAKFQEQLPEVALEIPKVEQREAKELPSEVCFVMVTEEGEAFIDDEGPFTGYCQELRDLIRGRPIALQVPGALPCIHFLEFVADLRANHQDIVGVQILPSSDSGSGG